jgi:diaminohydroxyphosphoribosylaminopyrimidine deaminase/5-amino-6-(5-phosphoribosylamino)uracil reductase
VNDATLRRLLDRAVRIASRGHGGAEPNPMVGCVIARADGTPIAEGYHRRCGEAHAEVDALRTAGHAARGATAIVTLEPCNHRGRTGPCSEALISAGVAEVVYAVADPNPLAVGGAARLAQAGVRVRHFAHAPSTELALPFLRRVTSGRPWISAKWAQSIDGAIALANGDSQWLSCGRSRALVHRERGRVDAILTGIGTVLEDDPRLTARGVRVQRAARRVVFDPDARLPLDSALADGSHPTTVLVRADLDAQGERRLAQLSSRGVATLRLGKSKGSDESMREPLRALAESGVATVLVEAGGGVVGRLLREELLDEAFVFVAPLLVADDVARRCARGLAPEVLAEIRRARLLSVRRRGEDALLHYRWRGA